MSSQSADPSMPSETQREWYYRGGPSVAPRAGDYRLKGYLVQPTHGVSVWSNPERVRKWGVYRIVFLPSGLRVIQRGQDPEHFEIVPAQPMPLAEYSALLAHVVLEPL